MKKNIFLVICVIAFLFSCSDMTAEDDPGNGRGKGGRDSKGDDDEREDPAKNKCKGKGYTIYTYGDCPEGKKIVSSMSSTHSSVSSSATPVDILFILDTSLSMWYYLNGGFQKRFKKFIPTISKLKWRMFFTNAGYTSGGFWSFFSSSRNGAAMPLESEWRVLDRYYLDKSVKHYGDVFRYTMTRDPDRNTYDERNQNNECSYPPYCSGTEQPLRALLHSFSANKHLTRKEAAFVAVIISNTDENPERGESPVTAKKIRNEFEKVYGSDKRLIVMNLVVLPGDEECKRYNNRIQQILEETNYAKQIAKIPASKSIEGGNYSICLQDYSLVAEGLVHLAKQ